MGSYKPVKRIVGVGGWRGDQNHGICLLVNQSQIAEGSFAALLLNTMLLSLRIKCRGNDIVLEGHDGACKGWRGMGPEEIERELQTRAHEFGIIWEDFFLFRQNAVSDDWDREHLAQR